MTTPPQALTKGSHQPGSDQLATAADALRSALSDVARAAEAIREAGEHLRPHVDLRQIVEYADTTRVDVEFLGQIVSRLRERIQEAAP